MSASETPVLLLRMCQGDGRMDNVDVQWVAKNAVVNRMGNEHGDCPVQIHEHRRFG